MAKANYTATLAKFVAATQYKDLPRDVIERVKLHVLDAVGIALGAYGTHHTLITNLIDFVLEQRGREEATIVGAGMPVPAPTAAFVNAVLTNFLDFSDGHFMGGHINDRLVPAALAIAELTGASGKDFLTALAVGYEAYINMAYILFARPEPSEMRLPIFVLLGPIAVALTTGKLLKLSEKQLAGAVGLAASYQLSASQYVISGGHEKDLSPGHEAQRGLLSALLAKRGILGSPDILEGHYGIAELGNKDRELVSKLGKEWKIAECYFKPYPACRYLHASIEAALHLVDTYHFSPEEVREVTVITNSQSARRVSYDIRSHVNAIFSHAYQVAAVLRYGRVDLPTTWAEKMQDDLFCKLLRSTRVQSSPEYDRLYQQRSLTQPPWPAEVAVVLHSGESYCAKVLSPKGDPLNPLSSNELRNKFIKLTEPVLGEQKAWQTVEIIAKLEHIVDMRQMTALLRAQ